MAQVLDPRIAAEQIGHLTHHFEAGILGRIMRGSHHQAGAIKRGAGVVVLIGADHPEIDQVGALIAKTAQEVFFNRRT